MIGFVFFLILLIGGAALFSITTAWISREHELANKWRQGDHQPQPFMYEITEEVKGPAWIISFRDKGKVKTIVIEGEDESEALMKGIKENGIGYDKIISSVRR